MAVLTCNISMSRRSLPSRRDRLICARCREIYSRSGSSYVCAMRRVMSTALEHTPMLRSFRLPDTGRQSRQLLIGAYGRRRRAMRGKPFQPGNKYGHGRPPGSRNKYVNGLQNVLDWYGDALVKRCLCGVPRNRNPSEATFEIAWKHSVLNSLWNFPDSLHRDMAVRTTSGIINFDSYRFRLHNRPRQLQMCHLDQDLLRSVLQ